MAASKTAPTAKFRDVAQQARQVIEDPADVRGRLEAAGEDMRSPAVRLADEGRAPRTPAQIQSEMDEQEWACRSQEHSWPQLRPGATRLPQGMRVSPAGSGNVLFEADCLHGCGRFREELTDRGLVVIDRRYGTRKGHRHVVVHRNETMTKAQMRGATYGSLKTLIRQAVKDAREEARAAAAEARETAKAGASS